MAFTVIPAVWQLSGFTMALYLGGIRSISDDLREAARVDGASEFQIYRYIILPLLQPVTLSAVIILAHMSLKIFDLIVALGKQGYQPGCAGYLHVDHHFRRHELRPGSGHRHFDADQRGNPGRALPDIQICARRPNYDPPDNR